jgi:site-specific recombinase XerD
MQETRKPPLMLEYLFGQAAETARRIASPRLLRWCAAFEDWIAELQRTRSPKRSVMARRAWKEFLEGLAKPPWEATEDDLQRYVERRKAQAKAASTIRHDIYLLSTFYRWCAQAGIDPESGPDFNPTTGMAQPQVKAYSQAQALSQTEAQALLDAFLRQGSVLSLRDHAFFLARLSLGRPLADLLELRWGQIETTPDGPWLRWTNGDRQPLEYELYAAILHYLRRSGRLESILPQSLIFVPIKRGRRGGQCAGDWNEDRCMNHSPILKSLKRFGRALGIADRKLTMPALRLTAVSRRLQAGDDPHTIQAFLGRSGIKPTRQYLRKLPTVVDLPLDPTRYRSR